MVMLAQNCIELFEPLLPVKNFHQTEESASPQSLFEQSAFCLIKKRLGTVIVCLRKEGRGGHTWIVWLNKIVFRCIALHLLFASIQCQKMTSCIFVGFVIHRFCFTFSPVSVVHQHFPQERVHRNFTATVLRVQIVFHCICQRPQISQLCHQQTVFFLGRRQE